MLLFGALVSSYSATANVSTTSLGQIRSDFYGVNTGGWYLVGDDLTYGTKIGHTGAYINSTEYSDAFKQLNLGLNRMDAQLHYYYQNKTDGGNGVNFTDTNTNDRNFTRIIKQLQWNVDHNVKTYLIIEYMPSWLADNSSGKCTNLNFCPANNYTKWNNIVLDYLNRSTKNNQTILNNIIIEVWNEPDGSFFMQGISNNNINQYNNYSVLYNQTYTTIKSVYPNLDIVAPSLAFWNSNNLKLNFLGNWSSRTNSYSFHSYTNLCSSPQGNCGGNANGTYEYITLQLEDIKTRCNTYGASCNNIYISEWNDADDARKNATTQYANFSQEIAQGYTAMLNWNASRVSSIFYEFGEVNTFTGSNDRYEMWSGTQLGNYSAPSYNITKTFANNHKAGNTVYNSSSNNSQLKIVSSYDGVKRYYTLTNTNSTGVNITLNTGLVNTNQYLRDVETNTIYPLGADGIATINNLGGYGVLTLDSNPNPVAALDDNGFAKTVLNILLGLFAIGIVGVGLWFLKYYNDEGELTAERIVAITIAIILALVFIRILADVIIRL
jgi:hypothetical protein